MTIVFIYQYLSIKDMQKASLSCRKFQKAFHQDYLFIELTKRHHLFLPSEGDKFKTWKDYFFYLQQLKKNISDGSPNVGYKMTPYRGHKFPIEALSIFDYKKEMNSLIVSGDSNGEVLTWNVDEEGDKEKDVLFKGDSGIIGISSLNDDCNMIVWTQKNTFYYYEVNMFKDTDKNSERFQLIKNISLEDYDNPIKQIYYEKSSQTIYMSPDINIEDPFKKTNIYALNLESFIISKFHYNYNSEQTNVILNQNQNNQNLNQGWNAFNNNNIFNPMINPIPLNLDLPVHHEIKVKESNKKKINYFVVNEDKIFLYINKEPVKKRLISTYSNKNVLPNVFVFNKNTRLFKSYHIDLDYIYNILLINNNEVAFMGYNLISNNGKKVIMKIFSINNFVQLREVYLFNGNQELKTFDLLHFEDQEMYYLINQTLLKKVDNVSVKQLKVTNISTLETVKDINCIEADVFRIILASDEQYIAIFDIKSGKKWFLLLAGSKTVVPKSFVKHPDYEGFHYIDLTRNSLVAVIGNLIREYKFTFKLGK